MSEKQELVTASRSHSVARLEGLLERVMDKALAQRGKLVSVSRFPTLTLSCRVFKLPYWVSSEPSLLTCQQQIWRLVQEQSRHVQVLFLAHCFLRAAISWVTSWGFHLYASEILPLFHSPGCTLIFLSIVFLTQIKCGDSLCTLPAKVWDREGVVFIVVQLLCVNGVMGTRLGWDLTAWKCTCWPWLWGNDLDKALRALCAYLR